MELNSDEAEEEFEFDFEKLDKFKHNNWTQWKFIDLNGKLVRRFALKKTAEKVRMCTAQTMKKTALQTQVWKYDNKKALEELTKTQNEIKNLKVNKKIILTSEEDEIKSLRRKLARNKWKPIESMEVDDDADDDDDDDDDVDHSNDDEQESRKKSKKSRKGPETVEIKFNNYNYYIIV